ncbi:hypothetical protein H2198_001948 [Neophaeococcomyces mojaviensis]|uniref:Uncharacterized protein n=1 Tax=Neophaeococcomyces mojaviensis TaxID=3383035 RepID=A0ACC3AFZ5_9EURO|nr:hypothetical protein H2198_001948 [Knufia sp. JES_112]
MARLCGRCVNIDIRGLFYSDFCKFARFLPVASDLEDDSELLTIEENAIVTRQRENFLNDIDFDFDEERRLLTSFLDSISYRGAKDGAGVKCFLEDQVFAELKHNRFARPFGRLSELKSRAANCDICALLLDARLWRLVGVSGENEDAESYMKTPTGIVEATAADHFCFLFPLWPILKVMWHDYFNTPNELCLLIVPTENVCPLSSVDDCFFDRRRDLRTVCLLDDHKGLWQGLPPLVIWPSVCQWLTESNHIIQGQPSIELGATKSTSFMLIDVSRSRIVKVASFEGYCYAALSYVWGAARTSEKWCQDIQEFHDRKWNKPVPFSLHNLPATLRDAITICHELGIPYLWVDSLCIAQNQATEKQDAIADMGHIYRGCYLCIVAAADGGVHDSLPGIGIQRKQKRLEINNINIGICPSPLRETVHASKWNSRGWVFQESTLAPRCLVVLKDQVFLQAGRSIRCEAVALDIGNNYERPQDDYKEEPLTSLSLFESGSDPSTAFSVYKDMVQNYSRRDLTFATDVEDAFRGLLLSLEKRFHLNTHLSLPVATRLGQSLNWFCLNSKTWTADKESIQRLNADGRPYAPSWTWLSRIGQISYTTIPSDNTVSFEPCFSGAAQLLNSHTKLPAPGLESRFATALPPSSHFHNTAIPSLASPLLLKTPIFHSDHITLVGLDTTITNWLKEISKHRYVLDDGTTSNSTTDIYVLPIAYWNVTTGSMQPGSAAGDIGAALLVELWDYPFLTPKQWTADLISDSATITTNTHSLGSSAAATAHPSQVTRKLTPTELRDGVFLARRLGIVPFGLARMRARVTKEHDGADGLKACVLLC